jgi:hypothetical protein
VLARAVLLPPSAEGSLGHSSHTQHERLLPTPNSRAVMTIRPTRIETPAATTLRIRIERRRARGSDANLWNGTFVLSKALRKKDFFRMPPGMVVTAPGIRAR